MQTTYSRLDQKPYETLYIHFETVVDAPVEEVWPVLINIEDWMSEYRLETLDGEPGKVGYFQRVYPPTTPEMPPPHYHYYGISEIIPHKLVALETFREVGGSYGRTREGMDLDLIVTTDLGGATSVKLIMTHIELGAASDAARAHRPSAEDIARWTARMDRYFDNLKRGVAAAKAA